MKKLVYISLILLSLSSSAQFLEFGAGAGMSNYAGDMVRGVNLNNAAPVGELLLRLNMSHYFTVRFSFSLAQVKGEESPIDPFAIERNHSFKRNITEISSVVEYHFLDYKEFDSFYDYSPYIFVGLGMVTVSDIEEEFNTSLLQPVIPFGAGIKFTLDRQKKYSIAAEIGLRKTFFDYLDGIGSGDQTNKNYQYGNPTDDDWYYFTTVSFSIRIFQIKCPYTYTPNKVLFNKTR